MRHRLAFWFRSWRTQRRLEAWRVAEVSYFWCRRCRHQRRMVAA